MVDRAVMIGDRVVLDGNRDLYLRVESLWSNSQGHLYARLHDEYGHGTGNVPLDRITHYYPDFTSPTSVERWLRED